MKYRTLTGIEYSKIREKLDAQLPADAYRPIPGRLALTDIDPAWMFRGLNSIFGLCGIGWGFEYRPEHLTVSVGAREGGSLYAEATITHLTFWYRLEGENGIERFEIPSNGHSRNETGNVGYALKGCVTYAIGNAASKIGWQESVYMGDRNHSTPAEPKREPKREPGQEQPEPAPEQPREEPKQEAKAEAKPKLAERLGFKSKGKAAEPAKPAKQPKLQTVQEIFKLGKRLGISGTAEILREISGIVGREIKSSAELSDEELSSIHHCFVEAVAAEAEK